MRSVTHLQLVVVVEHVEVRVIGQAAFTADIAVVAGHKGWYTA